MDDPANLLARIPELRPLAAASPRVARALATGDPHRVYRAVWWSSWRLSSEKAARDTVLAHRRAFVKPVKGAPMLFTLNGVGAKIYGQDDYDPRDGTYIGTWFATAVFVPIVPLAQYLCRSEGRQYQFFGTVPFGPIAYLWRLGITAGAGLGIAVAGLFALDNAMHATVHVVNGLDRPVSVTVAGEAFEVAPLGVEHVRTRTGPTEIVASLGDEVLERQTLTLGAGGDGYVYNVIGAAPVYEADVIYSVTPRDDGDDHLQVHCGDSTVATSADYAFVTPPDRLDLPAGSSELRKHHLDVADGGWRYCLSPAAPKADPARIRALGERMLGIFPNETDLVFGVSTYLRRLGTDVAESALRASRDAHPTSLPLARAYQDASTDAGHRAEAQAVFDAMLAKESTPDAEYLSARLGLGPDALARALRNADANPDHELSQRAAVWRLLNAGRWDDAIRRLERARWDDAPVLHATALAAAGRLDEAIDRLPAKPADVQTAVALASLQRRKGGKPDIAALADAVAAGDGEAAPWIRGLLAATVGDPLPEDVPAAGRSRYEVMLLLRTDPEAALASVRADPSVATNLPQPFGTLLLGEAVRQRDEALVGQLADTGAAMPATVPVLAYLHDGSQEQEIWDLDLEARAATWLARSRMEGVSKADRAALRARAEADDVLSGVVHAALAWPE